ncbi:DUF305 domain-containing protein [Rhizocola hellebori]|uniref:DUF305 domain-containing protein n=1 Tax=Rhizocola hellebori TaxID=1392758 RepID=A0A8J3QBR8_9ACTN|nr:DUF305 domain-containing protein [Rhizocola hellebori]GIH06636.1 DUF305 domain-containing protein [Rhizocola hellebori]
MSTARRFTLFSTAGLAVMLVIGLLLGYAAGFLTPHSSSPGDTSPEAGFARDMSAHHAQAVAMGMLAQSKGNKVEVRGFGSDIALTQQAQIGMMDQWLRDWGVNPNTEAAPMSWMPDGMNQLDNGLMPGMATQAEMDALAAASGPAFDRLFVQMMIKHHLGGIHMVDGVLSQTHNGDVTWLADAIKSGQQGEVTALQNLQKQLG